MSTNELNRKARELLEVQSMIAELEAEAEALRDTLKGEMIAQGVEILMGDGWSTSTVRPIPALLGRSFFCHNSFLLFWV